MKQYLLFAWLAYDAIGGWKDLAGQFNTFVEAKAGIPKYEGCCWQIVDSKTGQIVEEN